MSNTPCTTSSLCRLLFTAAPPRRPFQVAFSALRFEPPSSYFVWLAVHGLPAGAKYLIVQDVCAEGHKVGGGSGGDCGGCDDHDDDAYDSDTNDVYYGAGCAGEMACACVTRSRRT